MVKTQTFRHPKPVLKRLIEYGAIFVCIVLVLAAGLLLLLPLAGAPAGFLLASPITLLLLIPILMLTANAPAVTVSQQGLTLHPAVWKDQFVRWEEISAVDVYPLLPTSETEVTRRFVVGKRRYRPAEGIMLVIPSLSPVYRIAGFFAGTGMRPIIALTNRAHMNYDSLVGLILELTDPALHDPNLYDAVEEPVRLR